MTPSSQANWIGLRPGEYFVVIGGHKITAPMAKESMYHLPTPHQFDIEIDIRNFTHFELRSEHGECYLWVRNHEQGTVIGHATDDDYLVQLHKLPGVTVPIPKSFCRIVS